MNNLRSSRAALLFAVVFFTFGVGLPVIVASCPMRDDGGAQPCCGCPATAGDGSQSISTQRNTSCCTTVIASGRNMTEFITSEYHPSLLITQLNVVQAFIPGNTGITESHSAVMINTGFHPPPARSGEIPVLVSSLLI